MCGPPQGDDTHGIIEHEEKLAEEAPPAAFHINLSDPPTGESSTDPQAAGTRPSAAGEGEHGEPALLQLNPDVHSAGEDTNLTRHPIPASVKYGTTQD